MKGVNPEIRNRIRIAVAAYAYEVLDSPIMSDHEFDRLALQIDPQKDTGEPELDAFFFCDFNPSTGVWIHQHPDLAGIARLYKTFYAPRGKTMTAKELAEIEDLI